MAIDYAQWSLMEQRSRRSSIFAPHARALECGSGACSKKDGRAGLSLCYQLVPIHTTRIIYVILYIYDIYIYIRLYIIYIYIIQYNIYIYTYNILYI